MQKTMSEKSGKATLTIEVSVLNEKICDNCPYLKIEQKYRVRWKDENPVYYECSHLGMCEELKEMYKNAIQKEKQN